VCVAAARLADVITVTS